MGQVVLLLVAIAQQSKVLLGAGEVVVDAAADPIVIGRSSSTVVRWMTILTTESVSSSPGYSPVRKLSTSDSTWSMSQHIVLATPWHFCHFTRKFVISRLIY